MRFRFKKRDIQSLYEKGKGRTKYPEGVVNAFFKAMTTIKAAMDERDLYALKGFHMEKVKTSTKGDYSIRLNQQFRLIFRFEKDVNGKLICIIDIDKHKYKR